PLVKGARPGTGASDVGGRPDGPPRSPSTKSSTAVGRTCQTSQRLGSHAARPGKEGGRQEGTAARRITEGAGGCETEGPRRGDTPGLRDPGLSCSRDRRTARAIAAQGAAPPGPTRGAPGLRAAGRREGSAGHLRDGWAPGTRRRPRSLTAGASWVVRGVTAD